MNGENSVRIALVGTGAMGRKYAEMLSSGKAARAELAAVCVRSEASYEWAKRELPGVRTARSMEELFAEPDDYDAVLIALPHKAHREAALRAFALKKHVLCEKPVSAAIGEALQMQRAAEEVGVQYGIIFQQRTFPCYRKLKELLSQGTIGRLVRASYASSQYYRTPWYHKSGSWRSSWEGEGGGALINQAQHPLDIFQWLVGMPGEVYAKITFGKYNDFLVEDEAHLLMEYESGIHGDFFFTTGEGVPVNRLELTGTKGKLMLDGERLICFSHEDMEEYRSRVRVNSREELKIRQQEISLEKAENAYEKVITNFVSAILDGAPLLVPGSQGINSLILTNAAYLSAYKKEPVAIQPSPEEYEEFLRGGTARENKKKRYG